MSEPVPVQPPGMDQKTDPQLLTFFKSMDELDASDLHLKADTVPHMRVQSELRSINSSALSSQDMERISFSLINEEQETIFLNEGSVDLAYEIPGGDRFRINIFRQRGNISIAARRVTRNIPSFKELHLPPEVESLVELRDGLILLAGPTGSGKSTTIASMLQYINCNRRCHIVTIEDPIEYLYENEMAVINQREIGIDTPDFATALRAMVREDPDIVLIGEMRDRETFETALQAAETGHLVFGTVHASSADQTITRLLDLFEANSHSLILQGLAFNLRAIVCQKLLPCVQEGIGRVPAVEVMRNNATVRSLLEKHEENKLGDLIRTSSDSGMINFTRSLHNLLQADMIDQKVALEAAPNQEELKMLIKGIAQSKGGILG